MSGVDLFGTSADADNTADAADSSTATLTSSMSSGRRQLQLTIEPAAVETEPKSKSSVESGGSVRDMLLLHQENVARRRVQIGPFRSVLVLTIILSIAPVLCHLCLRFFSHPVSQVGTTERRSAMCGFFHPHHFRRCANYRVINCKQNLMKYVDQLSFRAGKHFIIILERRCAND